VKGRASHVIVNGRVQFKDGKLDVVRGAGRYLPRKLVKA
jgi:dihydropyrimidinase